MSAVRVKGGLSCLDTGEPPATMWAIAAAVNAVPRDTSIGQSIETHWTAMALPQPDGWRRNP